MPFKIVFTDYDFENINIEKEVLKDLDCEIVELQSKDENTLISSCADADALIVQYAPITSRVIENLSKCKVISRYGIGVDTIDVVSATSKGILICNVPDYCIDEVAVNFPNLKIIIAHAGYCWWEEAAWIASYKPNVYLDLANWQPKIARRPVEEFYSTLRSMLNIIGTPKIMFGSDWPALRAIPKLNNAVWVKAIKETPDSVKAAGIDFTDQEKDAILGGNAAKVLGLT